MKELTVAIPVLNGEDFINEALDSVESQTIENIKIVISDNGSTDRTVDIIRGRKSRFEVVLIERKETIPHLEHFNFLIGLIDTPKYMLLCHDDYLASPNALELASAALDEFPDVNSVFCDINYVSQNRRHLYTQRFRRERLFSADAAGRASLLVARNMFGIPLAIRTKAVRGCLYNLELPYSADLELSWRISRGGACLHINQALICNRYRADNLTWSVVGSAGDEMLRIHEGFYGISGSFVQFRISVAARLTWILKNVFRYYSAIMKRLGS